MPEKKTDRPSWIRYSGIGVEFAAAVAAFTLCGYWIDLKFESKPWGLLIGVMLGLVGGMYNLIRQSLAAMRELDRKSTGGTDKTDDDPHKE